MIHQNLKSMHKDKHSGWSIAMRITITIVLFASFVGAFFSMIEYSLSSGIGFTTPVDSLKILINHIFTVSEQHQLYEYERFVVTVTPENYQAYAFVAMLIILALAGLCIAIAQKYRLVYGAIFVAFVAFAVYFGIFPGAIWGVLFCCLLAFGFLHKHGNTLVIFTTMLVIIIAATIIYPGENTAIAQFTENLRDQFGEMIERPVYAEAYTASIMPHTGYTHTEVDTGGDNYGDEIYGVYRDYVFAGSQIGAAVGDRMWVMWLIGLAFVIGFAIKFALNVWRAYQLRRALSQEDNALAIDAMFMHIIEWLHEFDNAPRPSIYADYVNSAVLPHRLKADYGIIFAIWQKSQYSNHPISTEERETVKVFLINVKRTLLRTASITMRVRASVRLFFAPYGTRVTHAMLPTRMGAKAALIFIMSAVFFAGTGCRMRVMEITATFEYYEGTALHEPPPESLQDIQEPEPYQEDEQDKDEPDYQPEQPQHAQEEYHSQAIPPSEPSTQEQATECDIVEVPHDYPQYQDGAGEYASDAYSSPVLDDVYTTDESYITIEELSPYVAGDTTLDAGGSGTLGLILDSNTGMLSRGIGSLFECQRLYVYFEHLQDFVTVNRNSYAHRLIVDAGGFNAAARRGNDSLVVDASWIVRQNPSLIIRTVSANVLGANIADTTYAMAMRGSILEREGLENVSAVLNRQVLLLSEELLHTDEGLLVAKLHIANAMYPELFADIAIADILADIYAAGGQNFLVGVFHF